MNKQTIHQNAKYTFKYNSKLGRHGWLRLTPAYSVHLVEEILSNLDYTPQCVLEPFSGTGTTELVCANKGINSIALEINPFLTWLGNTKLDKYDSTIIDNFLITARYIVTNIHEVHGTTLPPIYNIYRWWGKDQANYLAKLKSSIFKVSDTKVKNLLLVAFCRVIIEISNASFNHVSTSFDDSKSKDFSYEICNELFLSICDMVADGAKHNPITKSKVVLNDSKSIPESFCNSFDTVITSPPYPNRISYIRELRPYMYWLEYLTSSDDASELDWSAIGGTWGKATSLLSVWKSNNTLPQYVYDIAEEISTVDNKSAILMANYVLKYFEDMHSHLSAIFSNIKPNGHVFYIIGNSNFYGITVPAEKIYVDIMKSLGFTDVKHEIVRKRNCNKQLYEFVVSAKKPLIC